MILEICQKTLYNFSRRAFPHICESMKGVVHFFFWTTRVLSRNVVKLVCIHLISPSTFFHRLLTFKVHNCVDLSLLTDSFEINFSVRAADTKL